MSNKNNKPLDGFEITPPFTSMKLEELAKRQLKPFPLPEGYLNQLRDHLNFFPLDYLFQVIPRAGTGFGVIKCLEPGCSTIPVSLAINTADPDGSRSTGFGGFASFQQHILTDDFHETIRDRRIAQQAQKSSAIKQQSSPPIEITTFLNTNEDVNVKPSSLSSALTPPPITSKRAIMFPSSSPEKKKCRVQEQPSSSRDARKPFIIDVDSFDTSDVHSRSKQKPIFIDLDSPDSEIRLIPSNKWGKNEASRVTNDTTSDSSSDDDIDTIEVVGEGPVPLSRFAKPKSSTKLYPPSRLSIAVSDASKTSKNDTKPHVLPSPIDRKTLSQAFDILGDKAMPRNGPSPIASSSTIDTKPLPGQLSFLSRAVANLTGDSSSKSKPLVPAGDYCDFYESPSSPFPNRRHLPSEGFRSNWAESRGLLDWPPTMQPGPSSPSPMYDQIFSHFPDVLASKNSTINLEMSQQEPELRPNELQDFYKRAVENIDFNHNATVAEARKALDIPEDEDALMDGMPIRLMPHQLIAVSWMVAQEKSKNSGGILGDEMGLGKTIQMIATMVKNGPTDPKNKATLILAPLALLTQWREEIKDKSSRKWKVMIYHQSFSKAAERKRFAGYDIVITTLDTLRNDWDDNSAATAPKKPRGLFRVEWYRVVIDEAQIIRNRTAKKSKAVCALKATYRWCLTGTPIFNTLWDIYPYLRFLRIRPYNIMDEFRDHIAKHEKKRPNLAAKRAQAVLATCMLRRQKDSKLDGQPLIVLPPKKIEDIMLDLSPDERDVYDMLEKQAQRKFNVFLRKGTVLKNFACILVLLLRLRQACGHPSLTIEEGQSEPGNQGEDFPLDPASELTRAVDTLGQTWVDNLKKRFQTEAEELVEEEKKNSSQAAAPECPICNDLFDDTARVTKCGHVFCQGCIDTLLSHSDPVIDEDRNQDPKSVQKPCPNCRSPFRRIDTYLKKAFLPPSEDIEDEDESAPVVRGNGVLSNDENEPSSSSETPLKKPSAKGKEKAVEPEPVAEFAPSTKILWLLEEIARVKTECPTDKIIVISQWTAMLSLCSDFLRTRKIRYVMYQGSMKNLEREESVSNFKKQANIPVMLMSLKCGGVGLNLTCANRVVSLDLAWSPASERQAFDRTHRLGQVKDVFVKRVMIKNTVEQRICNLQRKKQDIADNALGEGSGKKLKRITVGELANLFNLNANGDTMF